MGASFLLGARVGLVALLAVLPGCAAKATPGVAPAQAPEPSPRANVTVPAAPLLDPQALALKRAELKKRESLPSLSRFSFAAFGGAFHGTVLAEGPPTTISERTEDEGVRVVDLEFSIASAATVKCRVVLGLLFPSLAMHTPIDRYRTPLLFAPPKLGFIHGRPAVVVWGQEREPSATGAEPILLKVLVAPGTGQSVMCWNDSWGYSDTFQNAALELVGSGAITPAPEAPTYTVYDATVTDKAIERFSVRQLFAETKNGKRVEQVIDLRVGTAPGSFVLSELVGRTSWNRKGEVQEAEVMSRVSDRPYVDVALRRKGAGYEISGTRDGQRIGATFTPLTPLTTAISRRASMLAFAKGTAPEAHVFELDPEKPEQPLDLVLRHSQAPKEPKGVWIQRGSAREFCFVDARGLCERVDTTDGIVERQGEEGNL